jgi:hypothetical protein
MDNSPQVYEVSGMTEEDVTLTSRYHKLTCRLERASWGTCVSILRAKRLRRYRPVLALEVGRWFCISPDLKEGDLIIQQQSGVRYVES